MKVTFTLNEILYDNTSYLHVIFYLIGSRSDLGGSSVVPLDNIHITTREASNRSLQMRTSAMMPRGSVVLGQPHTNVRL